jgi:hypothetical protein
MGNNPIYDEHSREVNRITRYEQVHLYEELGENTFLAEKGRAAVAFIHQHPALCLQLAARRAVALWMGTASPWRDFVRADSILARFVFLWNALTMLGTLAGLTCLLLTRLGIFLPVAAFPFAFPLAYYLTQVSLRLRHPCDPILALLMATAATWPWLRASSGANTA